MNLIYNSAPKTPVGFPSGQREQTVNLPATPSKVRILPPPLQTPNSCEFGVFFVIILVYLHYIVQKVSILFILKAVSFAALILFGAQSSRGYVSRLKIFHK